MNKQVKLNRAIKKVTLLNHNGCDFSQFIRLVEDDYAIHSTLFCCDSSDILKTHAKNCICCWKKCKIEDIVLSYRSLPKKEILNQLLNDLESADCCFFNYIFFILYRETKPISDGGTNTFNEFFSLQKTLLYTGPHTIYKKRDKIKKCTILHIKKYVESLCIKKNPYWLSQMQAWICSLSKKDINAVRITGDIDIVFSCLVNLTGTNNGLFNYISFNMRSPALKNDIRPSDIPIGFNSELILIVDIDTPLSNNEIDPMCWFIYRSRYISVPFAKHLFYKKNVLRKLIRIREELIKTIKDNSNGCVRKEKKSLFLESKTIKNSFYADNIKNVLLGIKKKKKIWDSKKTWYDVSIGKYVKNILRQKSEFGNLINRYTNVASMSSYELSGVNIKKIDRRIDIGIFEVSVLKTLADLMTSNSKDVHVLNISRLYKLSTLPIVKKEFDPLKFINSEFINRYYSVISTISKKIYESVYNHKKDAYKNDKYPFVNSEISRSHQTKLSSLLTDSIRIEVDTELEMYLNKVIKTK